MYPSARRFLNATMAVLVVFTLLLGFVKPVFAEGEVPEDAPPAAAPAPEGDESPETLEQALSDGSAAVADGGALVPLASQSELDLSCVPDPYFYSALCPSGVCDNATINDALADWITFKGIGMIYLEGTYHQAEDVYINGSSVPQYLTLKGIVWDGSSGTPYLYGNFEVNNMAAGFLLQGFTINGQVEFANNKGLLMLQNMTLDQEGNDGHGLNVYNHSGPVTLNQVRVANARNYGVYINNAYPSSAATGAVTVNNLTILNTSSFPGDSSTMFGGAYFISNSPISINGLFVKDTDGVGVRIKYGPGAVTIKNGYVGFSKPFDIYDGIGLRILGAGSLVGVVTLDNLRIYDNQSDGILIANGGVVKLNNVYSSGNSGGYGLHLGDTDTPDSTKSLTINNSQFNWNYWGGVHALVRGPVSITNTEISGNWGEDFNLEGDDAPGLYLDNRSLTGAAVTITGLKANDNKQNGITILTRGSATLTNIETYNNQIAGLVVDSRDGLGSVTINTSIFNDNKSIGLVVYSSKNITLKLVEASNNSGFGAWLDNDSGTGAVTLLGLGTSGNHFHRNNSSGLFILSAGTVTITNIYAEGNGGSGVYIDNTDGLGGVSILAASPLWMNGFSWNQGSAGLEIYSKGSIKLVNVSAWDNEVYGAYLDNCYDDGEGCMGTGSVTISSLGTGMVNAFNNNNTAPDLDNFPYSGLYVNSYGSISLTNVEASRNGKTGIRLYNNHENTLGISSAGNVTVNNLTRREISDNGFIGISAISYGNITIKGVNANNNTHRGGQIGNFGAGSAARTVTISNSNFNGSRNAPGLMIAHNGKVTLSSVSANWNDMVEGSIGLWESVRERISWNRQGEPDSWTYTGIAETTEIAGLLSSNEFTTVLTVLDYGTEAEPKDPASVVALNWAGEYFWFDTEVDHKYEFVIAGDTLDYSGRYTFELYGYEDSGDGTPVDLGKTHIYDGLGGIGIYINNSYGTAGVTITNPAASRAEVNGNSADGLFIRSNGAVTVTNLIANDNGNMGVNITTNNDNSVIPAAVNLSGLETNWNGAQGVVVSTLGSIVYSTSTSGGNGDYAAYLDNCRPDGYGGCEAVVMKPVTLTKLNFDNSGYGHAKVNSFGNIIAGGIKSQWNNGSGLSLQNNFTGSTGTVTLLGTLGQNVFEGNSLAGMRILSNGNVTLSNFLVRNNGWYYNNEADDPEALSAGIYIKTRGKVLLSSGIVEANVRNGILIDSYNSVTLSKMMVMMNGWNWEQFNDKSGIEINAHNVSPVTITSSLIFGNAKHAILIHDAVGAPLLTGTVYFGNDLDGSGDADVEY